MAITRLEEFQAEYDCPIVLTGDFNANYTKPVIYNVMLRELKSLSFAYLHL